MLHHWCYQGFLAFRRRCGETLQDFCCPPGACGLSQNPPPITSPLLQLQDQRSSKILQPLLQLPPLFPRSHCTGSVWLPRPILCPLLPTCRPLQSATGKVRVEVILVADYVIKNLSIPFFSHRHERIQCIIHWDHYFIFRCRHINWLCSFRERLI